MEKKRLREKHHHIRGGEAKKAGSDTEKEMLANLEKIPAFAAAKTILIYHSKPAEAPTHNIIRELLRQKKRVVLPKSVERDKTLQLYFISSADELMAGKFGVMEPDTKECRPAKTEEIDVAVVPGVAFDYEGGRLGHGLGFYDRLLKEVKCKKIGLCFDAQIEREPLPREPHDVKMDFVVSEKRVISA